MSAANSYKSLNLLLVSIYPNYIALPFSEQQEVRGEGNRPSLSLVNRCTQNTQQPVTVAARINIGAPQIVC